MAAKLQVGEVVLTNKQQSNIAEAIANPGLSENLRTLLGNSDKFYSMLFQNGVPDFQPEGTSDTVPVGASNSSAVLSVSFTQNNTIGSANEDSLAQLEKMGQNLIDQAVSKMYKSQVGHRLFGGGIPVKSY